jgi:hypothetical protein
MFGIDQQASANDIHFSFTPGTNFSLISAQLSDGIIFQASTSTTSTTPSFSWTSSFAQAMGAIAAVFPASNGAGTAPQTNRIRIKRAVLIRMNTPGTIQFPCSGNLIVGEFTGGDVAITAASDDAGNPWSLGVSTLFNGGPGETRIFWAANAATAATRTITLTYSGTSTLNPITVFYDIDNADASPFDVSDSRTGNQSTNTNLTSGVITPSLIDELILNVTAINWHTQTGCVTDANGHTPVQHIAMNNKNDDASSGGTGISFLQQDDPRAHFYNTADLLPITFIYTTTANGTNPPDGVTTWSSTTAAFQSNPIVQPVPESSQSNIVLGKTSSRFSGLGEDG